MKWVTLKMIAEHAGKNPATVGRALRQAKVQPERQKGVKGLRLDLKTANQFIARQWPGVPPMA